MSTSAPETGKELRSLVTPEGTLELSLVEVPITEPQADQVMIRVEASPINPSDLGLLLGGADMSTAQVSVTSGHPLVTASISEGAMRSLAGRVGVSMPVGNEGAGTVIAAGTSDAAQALLAERSPSPEAPCTPSFAA